MSGDSDLAIVVSKAVKFGKIVIIANPPNRQSKELNNIATNHFNIVLGDGKVQESATHAQLLESNGEYAKLWQLQVNEKSDEI